MVWDDAGRPRSHARSCPDYTLEDEAFCRTWYARDTGRAPTYAEALAELRPEGSAAPTKAAEAPAGYAVPSLYITVAVAPRGEAELLDDLGESLRDALRAQAEIKARRMTGQRCGTCPECRGLMADSRCRHERITVERDAVRRIYAHAQAINPAALDPMGAHIYGLLVDEVGKLAAAAGIK